MDGETDRLSYGERDLQRWLKRLAWTGETFGREKGANDTTSDDGYHFLHVRGGG